MAEAVYVTCAVLSVFCAVLLARSYRRTRTRLLYWSMWCFIGLVINNALLLVDLIAVPDVDLSVLRTGSALAAVLLLVLGLVLEDA